MILSYTIALGERVTSKPKGSEKEPLALDKPGHCSSALSNQRDLHRDQREEVKAPVATPSCISSTPVKLPLPFQEVKDVPLSS